MAVRQERFPFVGRHGELARLEGRLDQVENHQGGVVLISGEPGIGKTRLMQELSDAAEDRGFRVAWGRCREEGGIPPLWPWIQTARSIPGLSEVFETDASGPAVRADLLTSASARFRLFDRVTHGFLRAAGDRPLLVALDDVHRSDEPSLLLLVHAAAEIGRARLLIAATYRDTEITDDHPFRRIVGELGSDALLLPLTGFSYREVGEMLEAVANQRFAPETRAEMAVRSGGNPLYLREVAQLLMDASRSVLPLGLREAITARIKRLPEPTQDLLATAAVVGRRFSPALLAGAAELSREVVLDLLAPAERARLVITEEDRSYFVHAVVQELLYRSLPSRRAGMIHERVLEALAARFADVGEEAPTDLAYHAREATRRGRDVDLLHWGRLAAEHAVALLAYEEGARLYEELLEFAAGREREGVLIGLGDALLRSGRGREARIRFEQAADLARETRDRKRLADAALAVGATIVTAGEVDKALVDLLEEALAANPDDKPFRARLLSRLAIELYWSESGTRAREVSSRALATAEGCDEPGPLGAALFSRLFTLRGPDYPPEERLAIASRLLALTDADPSSGLGFHARVWRAADVLRTGDLTSFRADVIALERIAEGSHQPLDRWYALLMRAMLTTLVGATARARPLIEEAAATGGQLGTPVAAVYRLGQLFPLLRETTGAREIEDEVLEAAGRFPYFATLRCILALLWADEGDDARARAEVERYTADRFSTIPADSLWLTSLCLLAEAAVQLDLRQPIPLLYELIVPHAGRNAVQGVPACWGSTHRVLGLLAEARGDREAADRHLAQALRDHEAWGLRFFIPRTLFDRGRILRARRDPDAAEVLDRARREAAGLGMAALLRRIDELRDASSLLTPRELEVMRLVAEGASNAEVAERLFISVHTVERHLSNAYTKLGAKSRTEATALLRHRGLV